MILDRIAKKKIASGIIAFLSLVVLAAPVTETFTPLRASAAANPSTFAGQILEIAEEAGTFFWSAISGAADEVTAYLTTSLELKDITLDGIAWELVNVALEQMIKSTTQWVNSGFEGSPAFVTDLDSFLLDVGDRTAGNFIWGAENEAGENPLRFLCSPFALDIKLALTIQYQASRGTKDRSVSQCRLSGAIKNVDNFLDGQFTDGGWDGWFDVALVPSNNPYDAMLSAQGALRASLITAQSREVKQLDFGRGFFTFKDKKTGKALTPGAVIQEELSGALSIPRGRLTVADEINELVGALMQQLSMEVMGGVNGLRGLSSSGSTNGQDYFTRMQNIANRNAQINTRTASYDVAVRTETRYRDLSQQVVSLVNAAEQNCSAYVPPRPLSTSLSNQRRSAQAEIASSTALIAVLERFAADEATLRGAAATSTEVAVILTRYNVGTIPEARARLAEQYLAYQSSGVLHSTQDVARLETRSLSDPGPERSIWLVRRENIRAEILLYTSDDPETARIDERCGAFSTEVIIDPLNFTI